MEPKLYELPEAMDEFFGQTISMVVLLTIVSSIVAMIIIYLQHMIIEKTGTPSPFQGIWLQRRETGP